jgi:hypothetical protein
MVQFIPSDKTDYDGLWSQKWTGLLRASIVVRTIVYDDPSTDYDRMLERSTSGQMSPIAPQHLHEEEKFSIAIKARRGTDLVFLPRKGYRVGGTTNPFQEAQHTTANFNTFTSHVFKQVSSEPEVIRLTHFGEHSPKELIATPTADLLACHKADDHDFRFAVRRLQLIGTPLYVLTDEHGHKVGTWVQASDTWAASSFGDHQLHFHHNLKEDKNVRLDVKSPWILMPASIRYHPFMTIVQNLVVGYYFPQIWTAVSDDIKNAAPHMAKLLFPGSHIIQAVTHFVQVVLARVVALVIFPFISDTQIYNAMSNEEYREWAVGWVDQQNFKNSREIIETQVIGFLPSPLVSAGPWGLFQLNPSKTLEAFLPTIRFTTTAGAFIHMDKKYESSYVSVQCILDRVATFVMSTNKIVVVPLFSLSRYMFTTLPSTGRLDIQAIGILKRASTAPDALAYSMLHTEQNGRSTLHPIRQKCPFG